MEQLKIVREQSTSNKIYYKSLKQRDISGCNAVKIWGHWFCKGNKSFLYVKLITTEIVRAHMKSSYWKT